jgi:hypothetical protein
VRTAKGRGLYSNFLAEDGALPLSFPTVPIAVSGSTYRRNASRPKFEPRLILGTFRDVPVRPSILGTFLLHRQLQPITTSHTDCTLRQKCEILPGTSQNVPKMNRPPKFDPLALRQYSDPDAVVGTVGKANVMAPFPARKFEHIPSPLAVRTSDLKITVFPPRHVLCVRGKLLCVHGLSVPYRALGSTAPTHA